MCRSGFLLGSTAKTAMNKMMTTTTTKERQTTTTTTITAARQSDNQWEWPRWWKNRPRACVCVCVCVCTRTCHEADNGWLSRKHVLCGSFRCATSSFQECVSLYEYCTDTDDKHNVQIHLQTVQVYRTKLWFSTSTQRVSLSPTLSPVCGEP